MVPQVSLHIRRAAPAWAPGFAPAGIQKSRRPNAPVGAKPAALRVRLGLQLNKYLMLCCSFGFNSLRGIARTWEEKGS